MDTKIQKLLPPVQLLPSEWVLIQAILEGMETTEGGLDMKFEGGVCYSGYEGCEYWSFEEPIRQMRVNDSEVRSWIEWYRLAEYDEDIEDAANAILDIFSKAGWWDPVPEIDYSDYPTPVRLQNFFNSFKH